ncbi:STM3941 family protein [Xylocopilactobacillus apis]|uniref:STM3941 family protein n=1 Tax=Xylocopilactobacillus apis TaxID=2932183 RepID=UPI003CE44A2B
MATKNILIPWSEVNKIEEQRSVNQKLVSVYLKEPDNILSKLSSIQRKGIKANMKLGYGEINITLQNAKNCSDRQLIEQMNQFLNDEKTN